MRFRNAYCRVGQAGGDGATAAGTGKGLAGVRVAVGNGRPSVRPDGSPSRRGGERTAGDGGLGRRDQAPLMDGSCAVGGPCAGGPCGTEGSMRGEHAVIPIWRCRRGAGTTVASRSRNSRGARESRRLPDGRRLEE
jgi:hypothetical protein